MNTRQLEYILAIAEEKNILRASEKLFISQSTLSQTLINLEKELGTPLFIRNQRELAITEAGQYYIEAARDIMHIKEQAYDRIRSISVTSKERYRVGISSQEGMERFLTASGLFQKKYPGVELPCKKSPFPIKYSTVKKSFYWFPGLFHIKYGAKAAVLNGSCLKTNILFYPSKTQPCAVLRTIYSNSWGLTLILYVNWTIPQPPYIW